MRWIVGAHPEEGSPLSDSHRHPRALSVSSSRFSFSLLFFLPSFSYSSSSSSFSSSFSSSSSSSSSCFFKLTAPPHLLVPPAHLLGRRHHYRIRSRQPKGKTDQNSPKILLLFFPLRISFYPLLLSLVRPSPPSLALDLRGRADFFLGPLLPRTRPPSTSTHTGKQESTEEGKKASGNQPSIGSDEPSTKSSNATCRCPSALPHPKLDSFPRNFDPRFRKPAG